MNKREIGDNYETVAYEYLTRRGVVIKKQNYRNRFGEIDLIGMDGDTLVFFEVKYRKSKISGYAEEAVDYRKQHMICRISDFYRVQFRVLDNTPIRYDVIAINESDIRWIKNAFLYC